MDTNDLKHLLNAIQAGDLSVEEGMERLRSLPFEDTGEAMIDHHRALRQGVPEVILGEAKTAEQIVTIVGHMAAHGDNVLVTRISSEKAEQQRKDYETLLEGILRRGQDVGDFRIEDTKVATLALIAMLTGLTSWYRDDGRLDRSEIEQLYWQMVRNSVGVTETDARISAAAG